MIKVLCLSTWFPLSMSRYFERAFRRRDDVEFVSIGCYTYNNIPWNGGMTVPMKYAIPPNVILPVAPNGFVAWEMIANMHDVDQYDLILTIDAGTHFNQKPKTDHACVAHIATDPHVLSPWYELPRSYSDVFFNMQKVYSKEGDVWLPYAYDPTVHYSESVEQEWDAMLIGLAYPHRVEWLNQLRGRGLNVALDNGPIFDEYRHSVCSAPIGLNWSSMDDLNARAFELGSMKRCPVMNHVTDMDEMGFVDGENCLLFTDLQTGIDKTLWAYNNHRATDIVERAYDFIKPHTYDARVQTILEKCNLA